MMLQQRSTWSHSVPDTEKVGKDNPSAVARLAENLSPWPVHSIGGYHSVALLLVLVSTFGSSMGSKKRTVAQNIWSVTLRISLLDQNSQN